MKALDPRNLISDPYIACPKCSKESLGVLVIGNHHYSRRCRECFYPNQEKGEQHLTRLPAIQKKVIYLDQFVLSEMLKALNPAVRKHPQQNAQDKRWIELWNKLYRLRRLQIILCPYSRQHVEESLVEPQLYEGLKLLYELLSDGVMFRSPMDIQTQQILDYAECWVQGKFYKFQKDAERVTNSPIHVWTPRFIVSMKLCWSPEDIEETQRVQNSGHVELQEIYARWSKERGKSFDDYLQEEAESFGITVQRTFMFHALRRMGLTRFPPSMGGKEIPYVQLDHPFISLVQRVCNLFARHDVQASSGLPPLAELFFAAGGVTESGAALRKAMEFFVSADLQENVPMVFLEPRLWSALARRASTSTTPLRAKKGSFNDISAVGTLLPYCDAMMVDKEWHGHLTDKPLASDIERFSTQVFSARTIPAFKEYLDSIEASASEEHLKAAAEVYGTVEPYNPFEK